MATGHRMAYRRALDGDGISSCKRKKPSCRHGPGMRQDKEINYTRITDWDIHALFSPRLITHPNGEAV